ncbi:WD40-repeat-containing domain protein [Lipomyces oligophaga]|uniref:WD40-repeat-containing domain protein n=1 Tax=Lipomyces oligophaga TaxID=45792 RepID=UPI0034CED686
MRSTIGSFSIDPSFSEVIQDVTNYKIQKDNFWVTVAAGSGAESDGETIYGSVDVYRVGRDIELRGKDGIEVLEYDERMVTVSCLKLGVKRIEFRMPKAVAAAGTGIDKFDISPAGTVYAVSRSSGELYLSTLSTSTSSEELTRKLEGHLGYTSVLEFFPSGQALLSSGGDMHIKLWNIADGSLARSFTGHKRPVNDLAMVDRGRNFLSASADGTTRLWECGSGQEVRLFEHPDKGRSGGNISFGLSATAIGVGLRLDHSKSGGTGDLEFGTAERFAGVGYDNGDVVLYGIGVKNEVIGRIIAGTTETKSSAVASVEIDQNLNSIIVARERGLEIWDLRSLTQPVLQEWTTSSVINAKVFSDNANTIALATHEGGIAVNRQTGAVEWTAAGAQEAITGVATGGGKVYFGSRDGALRGYI